MAESKMKIVICPGIHPAEWTEEFVKGLLFLQATHEESFRDVPKELHSQEPGLHSQELPNILIFPPENPAYSPLHLLEFLSPFSPDPLLFIAFSAGVVGAIGAARLWQKQGGTVKALIALDGWGVPLEADFPIHRVSHDYFTHWSSALLGKGSDSFYADPGVAHLELWRSPQTVLGHRIESVAMGELPQKKAGLTPQRPQSSSPVTITTFITALLEKYEAET
jgi:hypothetical protein